MIKNKYLRKIHNMIKIEITKAKYEQNFEYDGHKIKYLYFPEENSKDLLVVFSGFPSGTKLPATYNYMRTFKNEKCNRIFILDNYGPDIRGGSYYLGKDKDFFVERAVNKLVEHILNKLESDTKHVYTAGTSKGGYAALYYGIKYNYKAVICAGPQTLLGDYLTNHNKYFEYIAGSYSESNREYLNSLLFNVIKNQTSFPDIHIQISKNDHHYESHFLPFKKLLDKKGINYEAQVENYEGHTQVGKYYKDFAVERLRKYL